MVESKKALPKEPRGNLNFGGCYYPTLAGARILDNAAFTQDGAFITDGFDREPAWQENYIEHYSSKLQPLNPGKSSRYSEYYPGRRNSEKVYQDRTHAPGNQEGYRSAVDSKFFLHRNRVHVCRFHSWAVGIWLNYIFYLKRGSDTNKNVYDISAYQLALHFHMQRLKLSFWFWIYLVLYPKLPCLNKSSFISKIALILSKLKKDYFLAIFSIIHLQIAKCFKNFSF